MLVCDIPDTRSDTVKTVEESQDVEQDEQADCPQHHASGDWHIQYQSHTVVISVGVFAAAEQ
jgi:hypothetical protein